MIADHYRMHALCNEIGPLGIGLLALRLKPDIVTGAVRHYVRDAIEDRSNEHQRQERPDFLHDAYPMSFVLQTAPTGREVCFLLAKQLRTAEWRLVAISGRAHCSQLPALFRFGTIALGSR
jgi:hypothetical protein